MCVAVHHQNKRRSACDKFQSGWGFLVLSSTFANWIGNIRHVSY